MNKNSEFPEDIVDHVKKCKKYFIIKRGLDVMLSIIALIVLFPILVATAVAIKRDSKMKVIFSQLRTGKNGKPFIMYKYRSSGGSS